MEFVLKAKDFIAIAKEKQSEHDEQVAVVKYLKENKILFTAVPNGGYRHIKTAFNLKKEGVSAGYPDLMIEEPNKYYHGLRIEMKRRRKTLKSGEKGSSPSKVSHEQEKWITALNERGYFAKVCYGSDEAIETIEEYMENV